RPALGVPRDGGRAVGKSAVGILQDARIRGSPKLKADICLEETMRGMRDLWPEAPSIVVLTGAGISQESGLATFRDADGIWATVRLEEVATPEAFARDPARVLAFYDVRRRQLQHPLGHPQSRARGIGAARSGAAGRGDDRHAEHRRSTRAGRIARRDPHARRAAEGALHRLRQDQLLV